MGRQMEGGGRERGVELPLGYPLPLPRPRCGLGPNLLVHCTIEPPEEITRIMGARAREGHPKGNPAHSHI